MNKNVLNTMMIALLAGGSAAVNAQVPPITPPGHLDRTVAIAEAAIEAVPRNEEIVLMSTEIRTVAQSGLLIQLAAECGLWSEAADADPADPTDPDDPADPDDPDNPDDPDQPGDDEPADAVASGRVLVWVEVNGEVVAFGPDAIEPADDDARVAFCAGAAAQVALETDADDPTLPVEPFLQVRQAAAFNWVVESLGNASHLVEVKASFVLDGDNGDEEDGEIGIGEQALLAQAAIGKRTLVIQPLRLGQ
jgi:hypothetical protein